MLRVLARPTSALTIAWHEPSYWVQQRVQGLKNHWRACLQICRSPRAARQELLDMASDALLGSNVSRLSTAGSSQAPFSISSAMLNSRPPSQSSKNTVHVELRTLSFDDLELQMMIGGGSFRKVRFLASGMCLAWERTCALSRSGTASAPACTAIASELARFSYCLPMVNLRVSAPLLAFLLCLSTILVADLAAPQLICDTERESV